MLWNAPHDVYHHHLSSWDVTAVSLSGFPMLWFSFAWFTYFISGSLYFLINPSPDPPPPLCLVPASLFSVFMSFCLPFCFASYVWDINEITQCLPLSFSSLSIIFSRSVCVVPNGKIPFFFLWPGNIPSYPHTTASIRHPPVGVQLAFTSWLL